MILSMADWDSLWLSFKLASISTVILMCLAIPLAIWLTFNKSKYKAIFSSILTLPLILPPTVLGFYLLVLMGPQGFIGHFLNSLGFPQLTFSFTGLVIASVIYSLPFVLLPIQSAFSNIGNAAMEVAETLGASRLDSIVNILLPQAKLGIIGAAIIGFAHIVGEFGLILMIGGNIPQKTQVASIQMYNHFEAYEYAQANNLALVLLGFSFVVLTVIYFLNNHLKPNSK